MLQKLFGGLCVARQIGPGREGFIRCQGVCVARESGWLILGPVLPVFIQFAACLLSLSISLSAHMCACLFLTIMLVQTYASTYKQVRIHMRQRARPSNTCIHILIISVPGLR